MNHKTNKKIYTIFSIIVVMLIITLALFSLYSCGFASENKATKKEVKNSTHVKKENLSSKKVSPIKKVKFKSSCVYVYNLTDKKEIYNKNGDKKVPITSLVKLMNARKALQLMDENGIGMSTRVKLSKKAKQLTMRQSEVLSKYRLSEKLRYKDLLYAMILRSDAVSAKTLGIRLKGSVGNYTKSMNKEARRIRLKRTKYANVDGAKKKGQYSTAKDIVRLLRISMRDKRYYKLVTTAKYRSKRTPQHPNGATCKNTTIRRFKKYNNIKFRVIGGKYGYSRVIGRTVAVIARKHKKTYIIVVMGNKDRTNREKCTRESMRDVLKVLKNI